MREGAPTKILAQGPHIPKSGPDVIWKVWDPGSALSGEINKLRKEKKDGGWASLGEIYQ